MADQLSHDLASLKIDRGARPPSRARGVLLILIIIALVVGAGALASERIAPEIFKTEVALAEIAMVSPAQASIELTATGYVVPQRQAKVSAKVLGRIERMMVKESDRVKAGAVLYKIDDREWRAALSTARQRLGAAKSRALSAHATLAEVKRQFEREKTLFEHGVLASQNHEDREHQLHAAEEAAKAADQDADAAADDLKSREIDLTLTTVTAPFDGVVIGKPLDEGELVGTFNEKPAVELADFDSMLVECDVPESRLTKARTGAPCEVVLDAFPMQRLAGHVVEIGSRVNRSKQTITAKVKIDDALPADVGAIVPDMSARVSFLSKKLDAAEVKEAPKLFAPGAAVVERGGAKVVFVVEDGKVKKVPVTVIAPFGTGFELKPGLPPGTRVVTDPPETMQDGHRVKEKGS